MQTNGYDCLMIPGAMKVDGADAPVTQCGGGSGLATAAGANGNKKTVCCKFLNDSILFLRTHAVKQQTNFVLSFQQPLNHFALVFILICTKL